MPVPDTNTFSLQDVVNEINPTTDDLVDCVSDANNSLYDVNYYSSPATSLLEFRNYGIGVVAGTLLIAHIDDITKPNWSNITNGVTGAVSNTDGVSNTNLIVAQTGHIDSAAQDSLNFNLTFNSTSYTDWYLGARDEIQELVNQKSIIDPVCVANGGSAVNIKNNKYSSTESSALHCYGWVSNSLTSTLRKSTNGNYRPIRKEVVTNINSYNVGDYLFGGVVFQKI